MYDVTASLTRLPPPGVPFSRGDADRVGISRWVLDRLVRHGELEHVKRGLYRRPLPAHPEDERWQHVVRHHLARARASLAAHPTHALSHQSASLVFGWPVDLACLSRVHLTAVGVVPQSRQRPGEVLHHGKTVPPEVMRCGDLLVLVPARTAADCLRTLSAPRSVAIVDGAVRSGDITVEQIDQVLERQRHWRGRPRALRARSLIDPARETWLESYSFAQLHEEGIPLPVPQVEVWNLSGRMVGRVDGLWLREGVVAECDGDGKYLLPDDATSQLDGASAARRVVAERHRERAVLDTGLQVVRWTTREIQHEHAEVAQRVIRARRRGDLSRFRGRLRRAGEWLDLAG